MQTMRLITLTACTASFFVLQATFDNGTAKLTVLMWTELNCLVELGFYCMDITSVNYIAK